MHSMPACGVFDKPGPSSRHLCDDEGSTSQAGLKGSLLISMSDSEAPKIRRFYIDVSKSSVDDLKYRLKQTRHPDQLAGAGWDYGTELSFLKVGRTATGFDMK